MNAVTILAILVAGVVLILLGKIYNGLVSLRNQVERAWANIDVILKQRYDEIPRLVQVVEQYVQYESHVIEKLADARAHYGSAQSVDEKIKASQELSVALRGVFAIGENYPELKSNQNFLQLQSRVSTLEDHLADRREMYNETVTNFNTRIEQIPDVVVANFLGYGRRTVFEVSEQEKSVPSLKMNIPGQHRQAN